LHSGRWDPLHIIEKRASIFFEDLKEGSWHPPIDIYETEKEIVANAEVPGVKGSDIEISIKDSILIISGRRMAEAGAENCHRIERPYGRFSRAFLLPCPIEQNSIRADLKDGILTLYIKKETNYPIKIEVE